MDVRVYAASAFSIRANQTTKIQLSPHQASSPQSTIIKQNVNIISTM